MLLVEEMTSGNIGEQVALALIAVIAAAVGALVFVIRNAASVSKDTNVQVTEVNKAVNNIGPGEHRLYDKVDFISQELSQVTTILNTVTEELKEHRNHWDLFNARWGNLPEDMDSAADLAVYLSGIKSEIKKVQDALAEHVEWEMNQKYHGEG